MDANSSKLLHVCKRRRVTIMDLTTVILAEIISRLPIKSIFRCKCVCKCWYNLSSDPLFVKMYHTRSSRFPCLLLSVDDFVSSILELKARYDYSSDPQNRPVMLFPTYNFGLGFVKPELKLIGSCNVFICLLHGKTNDTGHSVYISNPLLGEYFELQLHKMGRGIRAAAYGFCFHEASGQYKVLRSVYKRKSPRYAYELEVHTLGVDKRWRNVGKAPHPLLESFGNVNVNGCLHWIDVNATIYSFDIGTEKVTSLPPPPGLETKYFYLTELWNCLCLSPRVYKQGRSHVDIWRMKNYGIPESWTKCYHIDLSGCTIPPGIHIYISDIYEPILIWKDGELLMQGERGSQLVSYNQKKNQLRKVSIYGGGRAAARYVPSFYSLKTVMAHGGKI